MTINSDFPILDISDLNKLKTYSLFDRKSAVSYCDFAKIWDKGASFSDFIERLPGFLGAKDIRDVINAVAKAAISDKTVVMGMGAHVIKVGLNPIIIDLMERGIISSIAMNGAGIIHDVEIALAGKTSEDVAVSLKDGSFGMARETCAFIGQAIQSCAKENIGLGESVGKAVVKEKLLFSSLSILGAGARLGIPVTVHIAIGTDIVHIHPEFDAAKAGAASHKDFMKFASVIAKIKNGVYMNVGSAVILPEVFLKAISMVRNLGYDISDFTTVNMDFIRQYRSMTNVVNRPVAGSGKGFNLTGHHEIMFPLIAAGIIEKIEN